MENNNHNPHILSGKAAERHFDLHTALVEFSALFTYEEPNERTIAILGGTYLEMILDHILLAFFPEDDKEVSRLLDYNGPLGTFSSKINMCYCLGLIEKVIKDDLNLIRKVRNKFAHDLVVSFDEDPVKSWCRALQWHRISLTPNPPEDATNRDFFQVGVHQLISNLGGHVGIARSAKRKLLTNFTLQ